MKALKFILLGLVFGIIMVKSEAVSWYRIQEMFRFQSFHMYGIIGTAVFLGIIMVYLIKRFKIKDWNGNPIEFPDKEGGYKKYLFGGIIFGLGWALTGACPGPIFVLFGFGYISMMVVVIGSLIGTYIYRVFADKIPK